MDQVSISEAQSRLDVLVGEVERGHQVVITRDGKAVARLVPAAPSESAPDAAQSLRELRARIAARGVTVSRDEVNAFKNSGRP